MLQIISHAHVPKCVPKRRNESAHMRGSRSDLPEVLTVKEAATYMGVSPKTILRWIARGYLKAVKVDRILRIRRKDLEGLFD